MDGMIVWPDWPFEFPTSASRVDSQMRCDKVPVMADPTEFLHSEAELTFGEAHGTLRTYRELVEEALEKLSVTLTPDEKAAFKAQVRGDPSLGNAVVEIHELMRRKAVAATVQSAHRSFILAVASATEEQARVFCDALQVPKGVVKPWKDLRGTNTLDRLAEYAFELAGLPKPPDTLWLAAKSLEQIRHCIAHANGDVTASRDEANLRALARAGTVPGFGIDGEGRIVLDEASGQHAIDVFTHLSITCTRRRSCRGCLCRSEELPAQRNVVYPHRPPAAGPLRIGSLAVLPAHEEGAAEEG